MNEEFERLINMILKMLKYARNAILLQGLLAIGFAIYIFTLFNNDISIIKIPIIFIIIISILLGMINFFKYSNKIKRFKWILSYYQTDQVKCAEILNKFKGVKKQEAYGKYYACLIKASELLTTDNMTIK